jgi:ribosomal protein S18 acetylase RimI-like enzyme
LGNVEDAEIFFKKVLPEYQKDGVGPGIESDLASILIKRGK